MNRNRSIAILLLAVAGLISSCAVTGPSPSNEADAYAGDPVVVSVEDDTDKSYTGDVGDVSSFYRDLAVRVAGGLSAAGVPATVFDEEDARRLTVRLRRIRIDDNSSSSLLDLRVRSDFVVEIDGSVHPFNDDAPLRLAVPGGPSPAAIREALASQIAWRITGDDDVIEVARRESR